MVATLLPGGTLFSAEDRYLLLLLILTTHSECLRKNAPASKERDTAFIVFHFSG